MSSIGGISIDMAANIAGFRKDLSDAVTAATGAGDLIKKALEFGGVTLSVEGLKDLVSQSLELGTSLVEGAKNAGIAQGEFNQLAAAFGESGVSIEALSRGIKNFQVVISEGASGNQAAAQAINSLGLSIESLKASSPQVQLLTIAEALKNVEDPADRARLGTAALGRQFLELEPTLLKGAQGLDEFIQAAKGLDAATSGQLNKFNEEMKAFGAWITQFGAQQVGIVGRNIGVYQDFFGSFTPDLATRIKNVQDEINRAPDSAQVPMLQARIDELKKLQDSSTKPSADVTSALAQQGSGLGEEFERAFEDAYRIIDKNQQQLYADRIRELADEAKATETIGDKRVQFESQVNDLAEYGRKQAADGALITAGAISETERSLRLTADAYTKLAQSDKSLWSASIADGIKDSTNDIKDAFATDAQNARVAGEAMREQFQESARFATDTGKAMQDTFAQAFDNIGKGGLRGLVSDFANAFRKIFDQAVALDLARALGITDAFKGQGSSSAVGSIFGGIASLFGGDTYTPGSGGVPANAFFANGGEFMVGGSGGTDSQLVQFKASPNERVTVTTPGQSTGGAGGGITVNHSTVVNIDARSDRAQVQAETASAIRRGNRDLMSQLMRYNPGIKA